MHCVSTEIWILNFIISFERWTFVPSSYSLCKNRPDQYILRNPVVYHWRHGGGGHINTPAAVANWNLLTIVRCRGHACGAMNFGSIPLEPHTTLAITMDGNSNTDEGGENADTPSRFFPLFHHVVDPDQSIKVQYKNLALCHFSFWFFFRWLFQPKIW